MKLKSIVVKNFRCYKNETRIELNGLTAFIGKNDIGKSALLEALEIFFNNESPKIDKDDPHISTGDSKVLIGCEFTDYPITLVIDQTASTSLKEEFLLNQDGNLEIHKIFDVGGTKLQTEIFARALHPSKSGADDLLFLKNNQLKQRYEELAIQDESVRLSSNPSLRKSIWTHIADLELKLQDVPLNKEDAKIVWSKIEENLPIFALFQADRPSRDDDAEVQDPMKIAVTEAIKEAEEKLNEIKKLVEQKALEVASRTLAKLREFDSTLADQLTPRFKAEPKWDGFKLSLTDHNQIPINKRGSGVRRLILLSFFQAEAERRQKDKNAPAVIFAVEEPESSQHPHNQKIIAQSLLNLADQDNCQVILTTHVPALANLLPIESLRYITRTDAGVNEIHSGHEPEIARQISLSLGSLPDNRVKVSIYVEGRNDIHFFKILSRTIFNNRSDLIDLSSDPRVVFIPMKGSNLIEWVQENYLQSYNHPQVHIYDRGGNQPPKYQTNCDQVNRRGNGDIAFVMQKNELENYLHCDAVNRVLNTSMQAFSNDDDVPRLVAQAVHEQDTNPQTPPWAEVLLDEEKLKRKETSIKSRLNTEIVSNMTYQEYLDIDSSGEIIHWLETIKNKAES